jgi:outer membrane autotransporter protein
MNCDNVENRYEVWGDAFGYFGHQNRRGDFTSYDSTIYGGMLGFQAPVNQVTSVGIGAGYAKSWIDRGNHNDSTINTYDGTLFVSYDPTHWYVDTALSFDWQHYRDKRHIDFPGIDRTAKASYNGQEYSAVVATGYRFYTKHCVVITPLASLQYSYLHVNKYHEHGAGDIDLHVKAQKYNFLESSLGLKLSGIVQTERFAIVPEVHGLWLHDFFSDRMNLDTTFSGVAEEAGSFRTKGPGFDKNTGDVGAGITFINCNRLAIELVYNYQFSKHYHANEGLVKITKRF